MHQRANKALGQKPSWLRMSASQLAGHTQPRPRPRRVDAQGRRIDGLSVIERGPALGHDLWIDSLFLDQVLASGQAAGEKGLKAHLAHVGLSGDGISKLLGRVSGFSREQDRVLADLAMFDSSSVSPDGDLAKYVLSLAEEAPDKFGVSISFSPDWDATIEHALANGAEWDEDEDWGRFLSLKNYRSDDPDNTGNLVHARLSSLRACDIVGDPAANANGLFGFSAARGEELAVLGERFLDSVFAGAPLGQSDSFPSDAFGISPDRARSFLRGYFERKFHFIPGKEVQTMDTTQLAAAPAPPPVPLAEEEPAAVVDGMTKCPACGHSFKVQAEGGEKPSEPETQAPQAPQAPASGMSYAPAFVAELRDVAVACGIGMDSVVSALVAGQTAEQFRAACAAEAAASAKRVPASQAVTHASVAAGQKALDAAGGKGIDPAAHLAKARELQAKSGGRLSLSEALVATAPPRRKL